MFGDDAGRGGVDRSVYPLDAAGASVSLHEAFGRSFGCAVRTACRARG